MTPQDVVTDYESQIDLIQCMEVNVEQTKASKDLKKKRLSSVHIFAQVVICNGGNVLQLNIQMGNCICRAREYSLKKAL